MSISYGSVCSGIEAASVAWERLGFIPAWFAEIEEFPSAVLAHHWPQVKNLGDMTEIADKVRNGEVETPDILVGGTPCQAFSVAGARNGLSDERGKLTISFGELADAIDSTRINNGKPASIVVWENVPGVLSSRDNAFGAFLGLLCGENCELQPSGGKWSNAGYVSGPKRTIAWRVLDAQYFGVAQRRKRVFVIASARADINPEQILFECQGVRRDIAPSRSEREEIASNAAHCFTSTGHADYGNGIGTIRASGGDCGGGSENLVITECIGGQHPNAAVGVEVSPTLTEAMGQGGGHVPVIGLPNDKKLTAFGGGNTADSIDVATTCTAHGIRLDFDSETFVVHGTQDPIVNTELAHALGRNNGGENVLFHSAIAIAGNTIGRNEHAGGNGNGFDESGISYTLTRTDVHAVCIKQGDIAGTLTRGFGDLGVDADQIANGNYAINSGLVRRLTPIECERLQGFPDNHTLIPYRGKSAEECPDGKRYAAIGNSMAVPVMRWIGGRIFQHINTTIQNEETIMSEQCEVMDDKEAKDSWRTPKPIYSKLNDEFKFAGDVAASNENYLHSRFLTKEADALTVDWHQYFLFGQGYGYVFCNPPYSNIDPWVEKAAEEATKGLGTVMLVHADPSVKWFLKATRTASEVIFINGRLQFEPASDNQTKSSNTRGSALLIWNPHRAGQCVTRYITREELIGD